LDLSPQNPFLFLVELLFFPSLDWLRLLFFFGFLFLGGRSFLPVSGFWGDKSKKPKKN
jgi:hypothetical protein